jgi:hypothetical protein
MLWGDRTRNGSCTSIYIKLFFSTVCSFIPNAFSGSGSLVGSFDFFKGKDLKVGRQEQKSAEEEILMFIKQEKLEIKYEKYTVLLTENHKEQTKQNKKS